MENKIYRSPLGMLRLSFEGDALTELRFADPPGGEAGADPERGAEEKPAHAEAVRWLDLYFSGRDPGFLPKLRPRGTPFRQLVWQEILKIPYGQTASYGEIAARLQTGPGRSPGSPRAVGAAAGRNPILLMIPCHRVIGADGSLTGYAGGTERKEKLLRLEGSFSRDLLL